MSKTSRAGTRERAVLAQVGGAGIQGSRQESLEELARLADTSGAVVVGTCVQSSGKPRASILMGQGKLDDLGAMCREEGAQLVIFDNELSASQMANLDKALGVKVIDRTELVLQVFARRARTKEAQTQVELAQLEYLMPRLAVTTKRMSRQRGGIGMRGPGEAPLEMRSRQVRGRIKHLKETLKDIVTQRETQSKQRKRLPSIALVGYTNVGKSTLINALTDANVYVDDRLFATLDATTRGIELPGGRKATISDTVGFIRQLPHHLVASFRSTLAEVAEADVVVHVADLTQKNMATQIQVVQETLEEIGAAENPTVLALNKTDALADEAEAGDILGDYPDALAISALKKKGLKKLMTAVGKALPKG